MKSLKPHRQQCFRKELGADHPLSGPVPYLTTFEPRVLVRNRAQSSDRPGWSQPLFPGSADSKPLREKAPYPKMVYETTQNGLLTTVQMTSEDQLIERVQKEFRASRSGLRVGIGDDAAVLRPGSGRAELVITTDAFLENVHFFRKVHAPEAAGYKALARATSDLAAMGARARCFFLTLGLPESCSETWLDHFLGGMARAARRFGLVLAGGDTTRYPLVVASLTVVGEADPGRAVLRSGAKPGDLLCVSGRLGEAELGLRLVLKKRHGQRRWARLLRKHYYPEPRLALGQRLAARRYASAMIDTSDGLSTDLGHICEASGVGAVVWAAKVPVVRVPENCSGWASIRSSWPFMAVRITRSSSQCRRGLPTACLIEREACPSP